MIKISIGQLDKLIDYMKMVRSDFIAVHEGYVIGYDTRLCILKAVYASDFIHKELSTTVSYTALVAFRKTLLPMDEIIFDGNNIYATMSACEYVPSKFTAREIYMKYLSLCNEMNTSCTSYGSLRGLDFIEDFLSSKAADGAIGISLDERHKMYIPSNILPVNKSDDLLLYIHDNNDHFISKFTVIKKKKIEIGIFIKFLYL